MKKMVNLQKLKLDFWDGKYKVEHKDSEGKIQKAEKQFYFDEEGIKIAIKRALGDFTDRTEKLKPESGYKSFGVEEKFKVLCGNDGKGCDKPEKDSFVHCFVDYFFENPDKFKNEKDFNKWHYKMCKKFLKVIKPKYQGDIKYGKAQKIVNMTFKNAYCLKGKENENSEEFYTHCHMPLDSIVLEWVNRTQAFTKENGNKEYLRKGRIPSWSKMNYEEKTDFKPAGGKPYYGYSDIQKAIFIYFDKYVNEKNIATKYLKGYTPLQAEFFVWKYMQFEIAAEGVYNQLTSFEDWNDQKRKEKIKKFKEETINKKLEFLHDKFENIEKYKVPEERSEN